MLTWLEKALLDEVYKLHKKVNEMNTHLIKANGYGYYEHDIDEFVNHNYEELKYRITFKGRLISKSKLDELFTLENNFITNKRTGSNRWINLSILDHLEETVSITIDNEYSADFACKIVNHEEISGIVISSDMLVNIYTPSTQFHQTDYPTILLNNKL